MICLVDRSAAGATKRAITPLPKYKYFMKATNHPRSRLFNEYSDVAANFFSLHLNASMLGALDLIVPPTVLLTSVATLPFTLIVSFITHPAELTSWVKLKHGWFKHFWWWFGPASKPLFVGAVAPLLSEAHGVVLDIGPARGIWIRELGEVVKESPGKIQKIYGIEPNVLFHGQLQNNARVYGLEDIYEPVAAYAQDLERRGIKKESVDTIITVHVLCSVGMYQQDIIKTLYEYLKPGGQWLVFEHVASNNAPVKMWQGVYHAVLDEGQHRTDTVDNRHQQHGLGLPLGRL